MAIYYHQHDIPRGNIISLRKNIYYAMPYIPASGDVTLDNTNPDHLKYQKLSQSIYASKYNDSKSYYYLFTKDLNDQLNTFVNLHPNISYVIPIASTHSLSYRFAEEMAKRYRCQVVDCIDKISKRNFKINSDVELPTSNILVVDDVTSHQETIDNVANQLLESKKMEFNDIEFLCIGKTERNLSAWDSYKRSMQ